MLNSLIETGKSIGLGALRLLFPGRCAGCDKVDVDGFCENCESEFEWIDQKSICWKCGTPLLIESPAARTKCQDCAKQPPRYDEARAVMKYSGPIARAIVLWKYEGHREFSGIFSEIMVEWLGSADIGWLEKIDIVIPSPQHEKTLKKRGFSPPMDLSGAVACALGKPLITGTLYKVRYTRPQAELERDQRKKNLAGSMNVFNAWLVEGKNVLLVDDVMTTGATMDECARALKDAGAKRVYGLVVARQSDAIGNQ